MYFPLPGNETEPLGNRLIEIAGKLPEAFIYKNPRSNAVVYVPVGSIKKGEQLVTTDGDGRTIACIYCHGPDLLGSRPHPGNCRTPPPATSCASFSDMQNGARTGTWADMMKPVVEKLTIDDMIAIAAYLLSQNQ